MTTFRNQRAELKQLRAYAEELLGGPVRLFIPEYEVEHQLLRRAKPRGMRGFDGAPLEVWQSGPRGTALRAGLALYDVPILGRQVRVANLVNPLGAIPHGVLSDMWAVPAAYAARLYRMLRRATGRARSVVTPPVMKADDQQRLWNNTVGFLLRGAQALARFGVVLKRGVLLTGEPGNGKTMAARWLQNEAISRNLEWRTVTPETYMSARGEGEATALFQLERPGVVLFDDFDIALRNRDETGPTVDSSVFLGELDGINPHSGVVYLFTSNAQLRDLDPAFRRPGRIDQVIVLERPDAALRMRLIEERWPAEMRSAMPVPDLVAGTEGLSFAELEEIRKLLVLDFLDTGRWDWPAARARFNNRGANPTPGRPIGFAAGLPEPRKRTVSAERGTGPARPGRTGERETDPERGDELNGDDE